MQCSKCHSVHFNNIQEYFYFSRKHHSGLNPVCKKCHRAASNARNYERQYGISVEDAVRNWESQGCKCMVCLKVIPEPPNTDSVVDHDHLTGKYRAILCRSCNVALGHIKDSPGTLARMVMYLQAHDTNVL